MKEKKLKKKKMKMVKMKKMKQIKRKSKNKLPKKKPVKVKKNRKQKKKEAKKKPAKKKSDDSKNKKPLSTEIPKRIQAAWKLIENHLTKIKSPVLATLNPPANEEELVEFEQNIGRKIPLGLRECYKVHNGQDLDSNNYHGPYGLADCRLSGVSFQPLSDWETHKEVDDNENLIEGLSEDEEGGESGVEDEDDDEEDILKKKELEKKKEKIKLKKKETRERENKESKEEIKEEDLKKQEKEDLETNSEDEEDDPDKEPIEDDDDIMAYEEGQGNRIAMGWIIFSRAEREEETGGFALALAHKRNKKPSTELAECILKKRLKNNEVIEWNFQNGSLADVPPRGKFVDWFEKLARKITEVVKPGHTEE